MSASGIPKFEGLSGEDGLVSMMRTFRESGRENGRWVSRRKYG